MPTEISGSTGVNKIQDNTIVNADINSSAAIAGSKLVMPSGSVLQVVSDNNTGTFSTTSQSYVTTSQSLSITPSSTSSKILVFFSCRVATLSANTGASFDIRRAGTSIAENVMYTATVGGNLTIPSGTSVLDSPNTTSATTYEVFFKETALSGTAQIGERRLHLMEIAG